MLLVNNINIKYDGNDILNNISFEFTPGKVYGLIGKNGAGKTTFLKIISRLITQNQGNILIDNISINHTDFLNVPIAYIGDSSVYYSDLTVKEHLLLICSIKKFTKKDRQKKVNYLLETLKLEKYKNMFPNKLSKGTLQRMNIAIGIIRNENYILMDEPFNALDPVQVDAVENLIITEREKNKVLIISSHDIESLNRICDIYLILKDGKILEFTPNEINTKNIMEMIIDSYGE